MAAKIPPSKAKAIEMALAGEWKDAVSINKAIIKEDPLDTETLNRLAFAYNILGKGKEAKSTYRKVLKIDAVNPIALRNLSRLSGSASCGKSSDSQIPAKAASFLEETGKTKVVELINVAQSRVIARLRTGEPLNISIKRLKVFLLENGKQYIGALPDDVAKRLIKFIKGGSVYDVYVKLANERRVVVFIKEIKKSSRFRDQPSFLQASDKLLGFQKETVKVRNYYKGQEEEKDYFDGDADE